jgi:hypothetical protein
VNNLLPSSFFLLPFQALLPFQEAPPKEPPPLVVKIVEPYTDPTGLAEVLLGVVRLTGVWVLVAIGLGGLFAYGLFWYRSRSHSESDSRLKL